MRVKNIATLQLVLLLASPYQVLLKSTQDGVSEVALGRVVWVLLWLRCRLTILYQTSLFTYLEDKGAFVLYTTRLTGRFIQGVQPRQDALPGVLPPSRNIS